MAADALLTLQSLVTKTSTFSGTALDIPGGTPARGLVGRVIYKNALNVSGSNTAVFSIDISYDGGSSYSDLFKARSIALTSTAKQGEIYIPFSVRNPDPQNDSSTVKYRLTVTIAGAGSGSTIDYSGDTIAGAVGQPG